MSALAATTRASSGRLITLGTMIAASRPRITTTTMTSIRVKPSEPRRKGSRLIIGSRSIMFFYASPPGRVLRPASLPAAGTRLRHHEPQIARREARDVRHDRRDIRVRHAEPLGEGRRILIDRGGRNPTPVGVGVVRTAERLVRERAVGRAAHGTAEDQVMVAPCVVRPAVVHPQRPAEIREREQRDLVLDAERDDRVVEGAERRPELVEAVALICELVLVVVEPALRDEE